ncbi:MAG: hypothetical protein ACRC6M_09385 [Microcystaceae cyanobacterium]
MRSLFIICKTAIALLIFLKLKGDRSLLSAKLRSPLRMLVYRSEIAVNSHHMRFKSKKIAIER